MRILKRFLSLCLVLLLGIGIGYVANHVLSENGRFEKFTQEIFQSEVCSSSLTLHYTLADPAKQGIKKPPVSLGSIETDPEKLSRICRNYETKLKDFSYSKLSRENQITLDTLLLYFHTRGSLGNNYLLEEILGPSLGIQAQLPVLLAEYSFYSDEDISDYLKLLSSIKPYFQSILDFEQKKSQSGYFMSDTTLDRILSQCSAFIKDPDSNYMQEIFEQKLKSYGKLSKEEQKKLCTYHRKLIREQVIPAYEELMNGLEKLRGTGKNSRGLTYFPGGRIYYLYLLKNEIGTYVPVNQIEKRLTTQLMTDCQEISRLLQKNPALISSLTSCSEGIDLTAEQMLQKLPALMKKDFPALKNVSYEIRYVHNSMKKFLSPAFYLTPPADTGNPNIIYLNTSENTNSLELFGTLAHEGFPGHLYQTVSFARINPSNIRYLVSSGGYVEGWATYVESYAYGYAASLMKNKDAKDAARLAWLNRSANLCIYSLIDIGIHYRGWNQSHTAAFLKAFGITDPSAAGQIYQYIVETPSNYLKYYWGYLNFLDLKTSCQKKIGDSFDLKEFHRQIMETGPVQFPVLKKYMGLDFSQKEGAAKKQLPLISYTDLLSLVTSEKFLKLDKCFCQYFCFLCI